MVFSELKWTLFCFCRLILLVRGHFLYRAGGKGRVQEQNGRKILKLTYLYKYTTVTLFTCIYYMIFKAIKAMFKSSLLVLDIRNQAYNLIIKNWHSISDNIW